MHGLKYYAIIVAGGSGTRMQTEIPKQFLPLNGRPVLMHTVNAFHSSCYMPKIIIAMHSDYHVYWRELCRSDKFSIPHELVDGGEHRFDSVKAGLKSVEDESIVAIHDAVRPCVTVKLIDFAFKQATDSGNAVPAVASRDSLRQVIGTQTVSLKREEIFLIQTPQVFSSNDLKRAYQQNYRIDFTDDASVIESSGIEIKLMAGDIKNIKITYPEDLQVAEAYLKAK